MTPQVRLSGELDAAYEWLIEPATREFARTGAITPEEGDRLLGDLRERSDTGRYFLARTYYSVIASAGETTSPAPPGALEAYHWLCRRG